MSAADSAPVLSQLAITPLRPGQKGYQDLSIYTPEQLEFGIALLAKPKRFEVFAPIMIGSWMDMFWLAVLLVVFAVWSKVARPTERLIIKILIYWLMIVALACTVLIQGQAFDLFVAQYGWYSTIISIKWAKYWGLVGRLGKVPAMTFFLHRAYVLNGRKKWILFAVLPLLLWSLGTGFAYPFVFTIPYGDTIRILIAVTAGCELLSDAIITCTIACALYKSKTGWSATDHIITRLLWATVETALPNFCFALVSAIIAVLNPSEPIMVAFLFSDKLHALCVVSTLLNRVYVAAGAKARGSDNTYRSGSSGSKSGGSGKVLSGTTDVSSGMTSAATYEIALAQAQAHVQAQASHGTESRGAENEQYGIAHVVEGTGRTKRYSRHTMVGQDGRVHAGQVANKGGDWAYDTKDNVYYELPSTRLAEK